MGGPSGASQERATIFPFPPSSPPLTTLRSTHDNPSSHKVPNDKTVNRTTTPQASRQHGGPIDKTQSQAMTQ